MRMMHLDADAFLLDTFRLGKKVYRSGFRPRHAISIWRGGTPVGLGVDAYYRSRGLHISHTTIATDSYTGLGEQGPVIVKNLEHLVQVVCPEDGLLIIDDVYESGNTIRRILETLHKMARANTPRDIRVATVHDKTSFKKAPPIELIALHAVESDVWIDYPHELADLVEDSDPDDQRLRDKDPELWQILRSGPTASERLEVQGADYVYLTPRQLLRDCVRLGVNISCDESWRPDFLLALWPGGVVAGLPIHEVYKYMLRKRRISTPAPDHISINTSPARASHQTLVVGLNYLAERINSEHNVLIIDTTFRAGRLVNDVVTRLKEVLRRNLDHRRVRVASVYFNPDDRSTWTARPDIRQPHYFLKQTTQEIIYPASVHKLADPQQELRVLNPELGRILYG